jgi:uncharacterized protein
MQLIRQANEAAYAIERVEDDSVTIQGVRWSGTLLVGDATPAQPLDWSSPDMMDEAGLHPLLQTGCTLVLVGRLVLQPPRALILALGKRGIAVEPMDRRAACRTYNVLLAEQRKVGLVLFSSI